MSKLKSIASAVKQRVVNRRYYTAPKDYWEERHESFGTSLEGIGRIKFSEEDNERDYQAKWEKLSAVLDRFGDPGATPLLDAGCGTGWITQRLVERGYPVTAVDFTKAGVDHARERVGAGAAEWHVSDIAGFRSDRRFDVVICIDVLFHIVDDDIWTASVRNLGALTAAGGHLVIQDHLVGESEVEPERTDGTVHTRWRSRERYESALPGLKLVDHLTYDLPAEATTKDLLVFELPEGA